jgi:hypothetical protein
MSKNARLEKIKSQIERLGRESVDAVASANRVVYQGIQKLAEQELKALNDYYKGALASLKSARKGGSIKDLAVTQIDLMQDTVNRVISHARDSLSIITETRTELSRLVQRGEQKLSSKQLAKAASPAKKALKNVRAAAVKARKDVTGKAKAVRKSVEKEAKKARKAGKAAVKESRAKAEQVSRTVRERVGSVLDLAPKPAAPKKPVAAKPSPGSRASRATSAAKKAVHKDVPAGAPPS